MTENEPTGWQLFRYYLRKTGFMPAFCFAWVMLVLVGAVWTRAWTMVAMMAFLGFVYIPALVLVMFVWKKDSFRARFRRDQAYEIDKPVLDAMVNQIIAELDENTRKATEEKNGAKND